MASPSRVLPYNKIESKNMGTFQLLASRMANVQQNEWAMGRVVCYISS